MLAVADRGTSSGAAVPVCATASSAERAPSPVGRNATFSVVDSPGPSTTGLLSSKRSANRAPSGPEIAVDDTVKGPVVPTLVSVTSCVVVCRTLASGKARVEGDAASRGGTALAVVTTSMALTVGFWTPATNATSTVPSDTAGAASISARLAPDPSEHVDVAERGRPSTFTSNTRPPTTWSGAIISARYRRTSTATPLGTGKE